MVKQHTKIRDKILSCVLLGWLSVATCATSSAQQPDLPQSVIENLAKQILPELPTDDEDLLLEHIRNAFRTRYHRVDRERSVFSLQERTLIWTFDLRDMELVRYYKWSDSFSFRCKLAGCIKHGFTYNDQAYKLESRSSDISFETPRGDNSSLRMIYAYLFRYANFRKYPNANGEFVPFPSSKAK